LVLMSEYELFLVRPNTQVLGLRDGRLDIALPRKSNTQFYLLSISNWVRARLIVEKIFSF